MLGVRAFGLLAAMVLTTHVLAVHAEPAGNAGGVLPNANTLPYETDDDTRFHRPLSAGPVVLDDDCLQDLRDDSIRASRLVNFYVNLFANMSDNIRASSAESSCRTSLQRANAYYQREQDRNSLCTITSSYVNSQVSQLFKRAVSNCRSDFTSIVRLMPPEDQSAYVTQARDGEAKVQATPLPAPLAN